jgi:hypothetical protein
MMCGNEISIHDNSYQLRMVVSLYVIGLSYRTIGRMVGVDSSTAFRWLKSYLDNNDVTDVPSIGLLVPAAELFDFIIEKRKIVDFGKNVSKWLDQLIQIHKSTIEVSSFNN